MLCINVRRLQLTTKSMCLLDNNLQTQRPSVACSVDRLHLLTLTELVEEEVNFIYSCGRLAILPRMQRPLYL